MREMRYRVWDAETKSFIGTDWLQIGVTPEGSLVVTEYVYDEELKDSRWINRGRGNHCVYQLFTGMVDKNGKEIYEGDILKCHGFDGWFDKVGFDYNMEVKYKTHEAGDTEIVGYCYIPKDREVVGNIFENPELRRV